MAYIKCAHGVSSMGAAANGNKCVASIKRLSAKCNMGEKHPGAMVESWQAGAHGASSLCAAP